MGLRVFPIAWKIMRMRPALVMVEVALAVILTTGAGLLIRSLTRICAFAATRLLEGMLYEIRADDPVTSVAVLTIFAATGLAAAVIPAWRAARLSPIEALHEG